MTNVSYSPVEYDPAAGSANSLATVELALSRPIDPQMTISVDGRLLPRTRDSFARAVASSPSTYQSSLLEASTVGGNTWIPVSATEVMISLDPSKAQRGFPQIILSSPTEGTVNVSNYLSSASVGNESFHCYNPCLSNMVPLSYPQGDSCSKWLYFMPQQRPESHTCLYPSLQIRHPSSRPV